MEGCANVAVHLHAQKCPIFLLQKITIIVTELEITDRIMTAKNTATTKYLDKLITQSPTEQCQNEVLSSRHYSKNQKDKLRMELSFQNCFQKTKLLSNCVPKITEIINVVTERIYFGEENEIWINLNISIANDYAYDLVFSIQSRVFEQTLFL